MKSAEIVANLYLCYSGTNVLKIGTVHKVLIHSYEIVQYLGNLPIG